MTTTPLPPLPTPKGKVWPPAAFDDDQMQAYATQARADLEAENARMADALLNIQMLIGVYTIEDAAEMARAALETRA